MARENLDSPATVGGGTVHVIATSLEGTRQALEAATALARGRCGRVVLFLRRPSAAMMVADDQIFGEAEQALRQFADSCTPQPSVLSCVCDHAIDVVQLFQSPGLVVIGGDARVWWPTREQRLALELTRLGCQVTFVHVPRRHFVPPFVASQMTR